MTHRTIDWKESNDDCFGKELVRVLMGAELYSIVNFFPRPNISFRGPRGSRMACFWTMHVLLCYKSSGRIDEMGCYEPDLPTPSSQVIMTKLIQTILGYN